MSAGEEERMQHEIQGISCWNAIRNLVKQLTCLSVEEREEDCILEYLFKRDAILVRRNVLSFSLRNH